MNNSSTRVCCNMMTADKDMRTRNDDQPINQSINQLYTCEKEDVNRYFLEEILPSSPQQPQRKIYSSVWTKSQSGVSSLGNTHCVRDRKSLHIPL